MNTLALAINVPSSFHWIAVMSEFIKEIPEWLAILLQKSDDLIILQISYCLFWKGLNRKTPTYGIGKCWSTTNVFLFLPLRTFKKTAPKFWLRIIAGHNQEPSPEASPLKMDGWKMKFPFFLKWSPFFLWDMLIFFWGGGIFFGKGKNDFKHLWFYIYIYINTYDFSPSLFLVEGKMSCFPCEHRVSHPRKSPPCSLQATDGRGKRRSWSATFKSVKDGWKMIGV